MVPVYLTLALGLGTTLGQINNVLPDAMFGPLMLISVLALPLSLLFAQLYANSLVPHKDKALLKAWEEQETTREVAQILARETDETTSPQPEVVADPRWAPVVRVTDELMRLAPEGTVHDDVVAARAELLDTLHKLLTLEAIGADDEPGSRLEGRRGALMQSIGSRFSGLLESLQELHLELVAHTVGADAPIAMKVHDLVARSVADREVEAAAADESLRRARQATPKLQGT